MFSIPTLFITKRFVLDADMHKLFVKQIRLLHKYDSPAVPPGLKIVQNIIYNLSHKLMFTEIVPNLVYKVFSKNYQRE